ncbi:MAG: DedA family protein [Candidatus Bathyarchaeia archaeon]
MQFAAAVEPGLDVFLAGKKLAFKTVSWRTLETSYGKALSFSRVTSESAAAIDLNKACRLRSHARYYIFSVFPCRTTRSKLQELIGGLLACQLNHSLLNIRETTIIDSAIEIPSGAFASESSGKKWMRKNKPLQKNDSFQKLQTASNSTRNHVRGLHKYWHYLFVISVLTVLLSVLALINGYFHLITISPYSTSQQNVSSVTLMSGYLGMFLSITFSPVPDYFLVPAYGYLSMIGIFNPYYTFILCLLGSLVPIEYLCGRFAARPLLKKVLSFMRISEQNLEKTDNWLIEHGKFSIFISTFIPFFYSAASLAAGTLKMKLTEFFLSSTAGFALRFLFLEAVGYYGIYVFTSSFDYSQRNLFFVLLLLSSVYVAIHLVRVLARNWIK